MSREIPGVQVGGPGLFLIPVLLGGVDGGLGEKLAVVVDDADVAVGDQEHDVYAGVAASDAEVPQLDW